jgi:hypothetical protein
MIYETQRRWNTLDFTGWEDIEAQIEIDRLEYVLPANVPTPPGTIVGHAWLGSSGDYIEYWMAEDESSLAWQFLSLDSGKQFHASGEQLPTNYEAQITT